MNYRTYLDPARRPPGVASGVLWGTRRWPETHSRRRPALSRVATGHPEALAGILDVLRAIPEEHLWLENQRSPATRRAYASDVVGFMRYFGITAPDELRRVGRGAVLAWRRALEVSATKPATIRRKLAALSSLFTHLVQHQVLRENPCREIVRPRVNARRRTTPAFSLQGLRDRALLSVGFQAGPRRSSIVRLRVRDFHQDAGYDCLRFVWKGGHEHAVALHPQTAQRIRDYLGAAGHGGEGESPLFQTVWGEGPPRGPHRQASGADPGALRSPARDRGALLGPLDARNLHHDGACERGEPRGRAGGGGTRGPVDDQALRSPRVQPGKERGLLRELLTEYSLRRPRRDEGRGAMPESGQLTVVENVRELWPSEAQAFTPWLATNRTHPMSAITRSVRRWWCPQRGPA